MDFIQDLKEYLEEEKQDYVIICVQRGKHRNLADLIYNISDKNSIPSIRDALDRLNEDLKNLNRFN